METNMLIVGILCLLLSCFYGTSFYFSIRLMYPLSQKIYTGISVIVWLVLSIVYLMSGFKLF